MAPYGFESISVVNNGVGQVVSDSTVLDVLWRNAGILDMRSYRQMPAFDSSGDVQTGTPGAYVGTNAFLGRYTIPWQTGYTTLHIEGFAQNYGTERIKATVTGLAGFVVDVATAGFWSADVTISTGYTAGQIITIDVFAVGSRSGDASYIISGVWATPLTAIGTYPGKPIFTTTWDATTFVQLMGCAQYVWDRMGIVPRTARRQVRWINGPFKGATDPAAGSPSTVKHGNYPLWFGAICRNYTNDILRIAGNVVNQTSADLRLRIYLNGTQVDETIYGVGTTSIYRPIPLTGLAIGERAWIRLEGRVVDPGANAPWRQSKFTFSYIGTNPDASGYPYATLPAAFNEGPLLAETLRDRLNSIATIIDDTRARLQNTAHVFGRVYAMRQAFSQYGVPDGPQLVRHRPSLRHQGSQLQVVGKGIKALWGPITLPPPSADRPDYITFDDHTFQSSADITDGDKIMSKTIYLDQLDGLDPIVGYELDGECQWCAEMY